MDKKTDKKKFTASNLKPLGLLCGIVLLLWLFYFYSFDWIYFAYTNLLAQRMETIEDYKNLASIIESFFKIAAIIVGGLWVWHRFFVNQEGYSHIESSASIEFIGKQDGYWIVELVTVLKNIGKVPHKIEKFGFDLNVLNAADAVKNDDRWGGQVNFPHQEAKGSYLPSGNAYFFIGPGVEAKYSYIASVPDSVTMLCLHSTFAYADKRGHGFSLKKASHRHSAECTVHAPAETNNGANKRMESNG